MFKINKDNEASPFSNFKNDLTPNWGDPAAADPAGAPGEIGDASDFLPPEPAATYGGMAAAPTGATRNVLNRDVTVVGTLRFTDDLLVDGMVEGEITSDGELTVGANAIIQAGEKSKVAVRTRSAIIHGRVTGNVEVMDRVELTSSAELIGDIKADKIAIQEGAKFIGYCNVGNPEPQVVATAATKRSSKRTAAADESANQPNLLG